MNSTTATAPSVGAPEPSAAWQFGPFVLDQRGGRLLRDGQPLDIAPRPWEVLCFLAARPGRLVTKDELLDGVWGHRLVSDSALKVTVTALRQVLGEDARDAQWVRTVPRQGYRFHDAVVPLDDVAAAPVEPMPAPADTVSRAAHEPLLPPGPASAAAPRPPGNLPAPVGTLVGREPALAALDDELAAHRLVTLVGPSGVGKTRLALAAAARATRAAPPADGVWLVRLDDLGQAEAVGRAVARTLGLGDAAADSPEALARSLAPRHLRLVLDNAEHLAEGLATQVAHWLQVAPGLSVLVTSQRPLQVRSERLWPVPPLALPDDAADAEARRASPAVALMVQRVQAQQPGWQPGPGELDDLAAIANALDGLPLALELAAARVPLLGTAGVRQRLGARLQMLTGGRADAPARHRTLRASLEWSLGLLPPMAARALGRLAVFAGGFTIEAAQAVLAPALPDADPWALLEALDLLQDMALLTAPATPPATPPTVSSLQAAAPRLRLLDSVRLLGLERLAADDDPAAAHAAHRAWVLATFQAGAEAYLAMGVERWLTPLEPEADNLMVAMDRGLAALEALAPTSSNAATALATELASLLAACTHFGLRAGLGQALKHWRQRLVAWMDARAFTLPAEAQALWCLAGAMLGGQGLMNTRDALALGEQAVALLADAPPRRQLALYVTGLFQLRLGQRDALATTLARMGDLPPAAAASPYVRRLRPALEASVAQRDGNLNAYRAHYIDALAESRALGDRFEAWRAAWGLGQAHFLADDLDDAVAVMDAAIDELRAAGKLQAQAGFAGQAVFIRLARDASPETLARLREVLPILRTQGLVFAALGDALAWVPLRQGRLADALRVQAWVDARTAADNELRSHVAQRLRDRFAERTGHAAPPDAPPLDEDGALRLVWAGTGPGNLPDTQP